MPRPGQNAPHRGSAEVDALPLAQQLGEVGMVGALIALGGQLNHGGSLSGREGVVGTAAAVTVGEGGGTLLAVAGQHPAGVSLTHPQKPRRPGRWAPGIPKRS